MRSFICTPLLILTWCIVLARARWVRRQSPTSDVYPYNPNPPRQNPDYCIGFEITYPTQYGLAFPVGSMTSVSWKVDPSVPYAPDIITRIRVLGADQHNDATIGENITIYTHDNMGTATFPVQVNDALASYHYRVMVNYPGTTVHCIFESVPFVVVPNPTARYSANDTPPPPYAVTYDKP